MPMTNWAENAPVLPVDTDDAPPVPRVALVLSTLLWVDLSNLYVWAVLLVTFSFGLLGFMDDYLKVTKRTSAGISARMKLLVQLLVAGSAVFHAQGGDYRGAIAALRAANRRA